MPTDNRTIARQVREEIWNNKNYGLAEEIVGPECGLDVHDPLTPEFGKGPAALKKLVDLYITAFPDAHCAVNEVIAEGDRALVRWTATATHSGNLLQIPPTNKRVSIEGVDIYHLSDGKIQNIRIIWDAMRFVQQLGIGR